VNVTLIVETLRHRVPGGIGVATQALRDRLIASDDVVVDEYWARGGVGGQSSMLPRPLLYEAWSRVGRPAIGGPSTSERGIDVLHAPMLFGPTQCGVPTIFTVHDLAWRGDHDVRSRRSVRLHERMWQRIVASRATVITSTETMAGTLVEAGLAAERCVVIPLGVESREAVEPSEILEPGSPYILSVSTLEPRKNLAGLLDAFRLSGLWSDGYELVIVGPDGWELEIATLIETQPREVAQGVRTLGYVSDAELGALYRAAAAAAYPSFSEGFGLPVLEAMSWGTPVVTSSHGSTAEVAGAAGILVDPSRPDDIAAGLVAATDPARRAGLGAAGLARAAELSWDSHVERTIGLYRDVSGSRG